MCANPDTRSLAVMKLAYTWPKLDVSLAAESMARQPGDYIESPTFCDDKYQDIKWRLLLYPKGLNSKFEGFMSLFVICESTRYIITSVPPNIECTIRRDYESPTVNSHNQSYVSCEKRDNCWGFPQFISNDALHRPRTHRDHHYNHRITSESCTYAITCKVDSIGFILPHTNCQLHYDIGKLLETQKFSDVKLNSNEEIFNAHKTILAARSPVFEAMFENEMLEKTEGLVTIVDVSNEVLKEILQYIYTGKEPNFEKTDVFGLVSAADKYQLDELKIMCARYLWNNLTSENVSDILILADAHHATELKAQAIKFINGHTKEVFATDSYTILRKLHQYLVVDCYEALMTPANSNGTI